MAKNATIPATHLELEVPASNLTFVSGEIKYFTAILPHDPIARIVAITVIGNVRMGVKRGQAASNGTYDYLGKEIHIYGPPFGKRMINIFKEASFLSACHNSKLKLWHIISFKILQIKSTSLSLQITFYKTIILRKGV